MTADRRYIPAAHLPLFLPAYDPIMWLLGFRRALRPLVQQAALEPGHVVLDVGCGTGSLAVWIKQRHPQVSLSGIDPDPDALAIATRKAAAAGVAIRFDRGFGDSLPYGDSTFHRVFSSMMLHHVPRREKPGLFGDVFRVLKPGGRMEVLDFANERLPAMMQAAGFVETRRLESRRTIVGAITYYQASRPAS